MIKRVIPNGPRHLSGQPPRFPSRFQPSPYQSRGNMHNGYETIRHYDKIRQHPRFEYRTRPPPRIKSPPQSSSAALPPLRWTNAAGDGGHFASADISRAYTGLKLSMSSSSSSADSICSSRQDQSSSSSVEPPSPLSSKQDLPIVQSIQLDQVDLEPACEVKQNVRVEMEKAPPTAADLRDNLPTNIDTTVNMLRRLGDKAEWMVVAAEYRRKRNLMAAEQVIAGFLQCESLPNS